MTTTANDLVRREVYHCASHLVSLISQGYGERLPEQLSEAAEQAMELCSPIDDYEEAAYQEGWTVDGNSFVNHRLATTSSEASPEDACGWEDLCREFDIEPYRRDVFEHWIISDRLADKLAALGEKVDKDFAGLTIWARTTTGQAIASDSVIERIATDLNGEA